MLTQISKIKNMLMKEPESKASLLQSPLRVPTPIRIYDRFPWFDSDYPPRERNDPIRYEDQSTTPLPVRRVQPSELKKGGIYRAASGLPVRALGITPGGNMVLVQYDRRLFNQGEYVEIGCYSVPMTQTRDHLGFSIIHEPPVDYYENEDF